MRIWSSGIVTLVSSVWPTSRKVSRPIFMPAWRRRNTPPSSWAQRREQTTTDNDRQRQQTNAPAVVICRSLFLSVFVMFFSRTFEPARLLGLPPQHELDLRVQRAQLVTGPA